MAVKIKRWYNEEIIVGKFFPVTFVVSWVVTHDATGSHNLSRESDVDDVTVEMIHPDTGQWVDITPLLYVREFNKPMMDIVDKAVDQAVDREEEE